MKLRSLIVDDEQEVATALRFLLEEFFPDMKILGITLTAVEAVKKIRKEEVDILFLDIEMPGNNGFDLLRMIGDEIPYVIFTTAHSEYTIKAIRNGAKDYLLKPIDPDELIEAVERARKHLNKNQARSASQGFGAISVNTSSGVIILNREEILYIKADGRYSEICCKSGQRYTICKTLREYEHELTGDFFFRVHKSYLINCRYVIRINSSDGGFVEMINKKEIEISKRKKTDFLRFLQKN